MSKKHFPWKRFIPLLILLIILCLFFYFRLYQYLSFDMLKAKREFLFNWTEQHYLLAVFYYMLIYIIAVAVSIPGAAILTICGGFLFGAFFGTIYVVISATLGACILFLAAKTAFSDILANKAGPFIKQMKQGFQENAISYLLVLRLIPLFPFWLVNIVPAILNIPLSIFFFTTLVGIIPGSLVYVLIGNGLDSILANNQSPDLGIIFNPAILAPLIGLALLALAPIVYKRFKKPKR